jgi:hypothetical protein
MSDPERSAKMKNLLLVLLLTATLRGAPPELQFLESLLPHSKHTSSYILKSVPSGIIVAQYSGTDSLDTITECLSKALAVKFVEVPNPKKDGLFYAIWGNGEGRIQKDEYRRIQAEDITADIGIIHLLDDSEGVTIRIISIYIIRKKA